MWKPNAQLEKASAGAVADLVTSCLVKEQPSFSIFSAAAGAYPELNSALAPYHEKVTSEIATCVSEWDQWDLPGETVSANAGLPILITRLVVVGSVVGGLLQPYLRPQFPWWGAPPWSGIYDYSLNPIFGGIYGQGLPNPPLHFVYPVNVSVTTYALPDLTLEDLYHFEDSKAVTAFLARGAFLKNQLDTIREEIKKLLELEDDEEHSFKPTEYASEFALTLIHAAYERVDGVFPMPDIAPDGESGIVIEWERENKSGRRLVSLIIRSNPLQRSYLYLRSDAASEVKYNLSGQLIAEQLAWLLS